jgi:hypothetical protein
MKTLSVLITILLLGCTMLFTSCTKDELSAPQLHEDVLASDRSPVAKPFKGDYIANVQFIGQEGPIVTLHIEAEGNATHIGNSTWVGNQYVNYTNAPDITLFGEYIMTAANGDRFWGTFDGEGVHNEGEKASFSGMMYVEDGDGRFEGAGGELPYYGVSGWFVFHDGTLIY